MLSSTVDNGNQFTIQQFAELNPGTKNENRFKWPNDDKNSPFLWDGYTLPLDKSSPGGKYGKLNFVSCPIDTSLIRVGNFDRIDCMPWKDGGAGWCLVYLFKRAWDVYRGVGQGKKDFRNLLRKTPDFHKN